METKMITRNKLAKYFNNICFLFLKIIQLRFVEVGFCCDVIRSQYLTTFCWYLENLSKQTDFNIKQKSQQKQKTLIFIKDFNMPDFWLDIFVYFP